MEHLKINNLGPIEDVDIDFGDLTFFVGPQASGKSITLETLKLAEDCDSIIATLDRYNYILGHNAKRILNVYFGEGMDAIWSKDTHVSLDGRELTLDNLPTPRREGESHVFYIPAQRIICMGDGYPRFFGDFSFTTPYVLREFTETLRTFLQFGMGDRRVIFPLREETDKVGERVFDANIFHDGEVVMDEVAGQKKMLLSVDGLRIPFMAWSAGQKEFMPLLLGFYCLQNSPSKVMKRERYSTVVIEEPEMGLHPKAIVSVLLQICALMREGYKVIVSTHSPIFMEFAWAFNTLRDHCNDFQSAMCRLFEVSVDSVEGKMLKGIVEKRVRTYFFSRDTDFSRHAGLGKVRARDISTLDVASEEPALAEWGGLSEFSTRVNDIVAQYYTGYEQ